MIEHISEMILRYLINAGVAKKNEEEIAYYKYGIEITISSILNVVLILLIGVISKSVLESVLFLSCFIPLRQFTGGYHADTYFKCNSMFAALFILLLIVYKLTYDKISFYGCVLIALFSIIIYISECPIEHHNKQLTSSQKIRNKRLAVILGVLYGITGVLSKVLLFNTGLIYLYTMMLISVLVLVATIYNRRKEEKQ